MKTPIRYHFALLAACVALPAAGLRAQAPAAATSATPSVSMPAASPAAADTEEHEGARMKALAKLTPEERQKLKAAHQAAMQDPSVKAAEAEKAGDRKDKRAYREAMRAAMIKADPSVQPILDKMKEERREEHPRKKDL